MSKRKRPASDLSPRAASQTEKNRAINFGECLELFVQSKSTAKHERDTIIIHPSMWNMISRLRLDQGTFGTKERPIKIPFPMKTFTEFIRQCYQSTIGPLSQDDVIPLWYFSIQFQMKDFQNDLEAYILKDLIERVNFDGALRLVVQLQGIQSSDNTVNPAFGGVHWLTNELALAIWAKFVCILHKLVKGPLARQGRQKVTPIPDDEANKIMTKVVNSLFPNIQTFLLENEDTQERVCSDIKSAMSLFSIVDYYRLEIEDLFRSYRKISIRDDFAKADRENRKRLPQVRKQHENLMFMLKRMKHSNNQEVNPLLLQRQWSKGLSPLGLLYALRHPCFHDVHPTDALPSRFLSDILGLKLLEQLEKCYSCNKEPKTANKTAIQMVLRTIIPLFTSHLNAQTGHLHSRWAFIFDMLGPFDMSSASIQRFIVSSEQKEQREEQKEQKEPKKDKKEKEGKEKKEKEGKTDTNIDDNDDPWPEWVDESITDSRTHTTICDVTNAKTIWHPAQHQQEEFAALLSLPLCNMTTTTLPFQRPTYRYVGSSLPFESTKPLDNHLLLFYLALIGFSDILPMSDFQTRELMQCLQQLGFETRLKLIQLFQLQLSTSSKQAAPHILKVVRKQWESVYKFGLARSMSSLSKAVFEIALRTRCDKVYCAPDLTNARLDGQWDHWLHLSFGSFRIVQKKEERKEEEEEEKERWRILLQIPYETMLSHEELWKTMSRVYRTETSSQIRQLIRYILKFKLYKLTQRFMCSKEFDLSPFDFTHEDYHHFFADRLRYSLPVQQEYSITLLCEANDKSRMDNKDRNTPSIGHQYHIGQLVDVYDAGWNTQETPWCPAEITDIQHNEDQKEQLQIRFIGFEKRYDRSIVPVNEPNKIALFGTYTSIDMLIEPQISPNDETDQKKIADRRLELEEDLSEDDDDDILEEMIDNRQPPNNNLPQNAAILNNNPPQNAQNAALIAPPVPPAPPAALPAPVVPPGIAYGGQVL